MPPLALRRCRPLSCSRLHSLQHSLTSFVLQADSKYTPLKPGIASVALNHLGQETWPTEHQLPAQSGSLRRGRQRSLHADKLASRPASSPSQACLNRLTRLAAKPSGALLCIPAFALSALTHLSDSRPSHTQHLAGAPSSSRRLRRTSSATSVLLASLQGPGMSLGWPTQRLSSSARLLMATSSAWCGLAERLQPASLQCWLERCSMLQARSAARVQHTGTFRHSPDNPLANPGLQGSDGAFSESLVRCTQGTGHVNCTHFTCMVLCRRAKAPLARVHTTRGPTSAWRRQLALPGAMHSRPRTTTWNPPLGGSACSSPALQDRLHQPAHKPCPLWMAACASCLHREGD